MANPPVFDFITFSFGSLAFRSALQDKEFLEKCKFGKLVMVCPVNQMSSWANILGKNDFTKRMTLAYAERKFPFDHTLGKTWDDKDTCGVELQTLTKDNIDEMFPLDVSLFEEILI
eukprot:UN25480